jgi:hypothetical protein
MYGNPDKKQELTPALKNYYFQRGYQSALEMDENLPVVKYMREQIDRVLHNADYVDDPVAVIEAWDAGFRSGISERISRWHSARDAVRQVLSPPAEAEFACRSSIVRRISGTLRAKGNGRKS